MEGFLWNVAAGITIAAITGVVGSAFLRPKLFMDLYLYLVMTAQAVAMVGLGMVIGGKIMPGLLAFLIGATTAVVLVFVLRQIALERSERDSGAE